MRLKLDSFSLLYRYYHDNQPVLGRRPPQAESRTPSDVMQDPYCHSSSIKVERPAEVAFEIMSEGIKQGRWTWGSFDRTEVEPGLFMGHSVFTGRATYVKLHVDRPRLVVDYEVGPSKDALQFRNMSRVIPGQRAQAGPEFMRRHAVVLAACVANRCGLDSVRMHPRGGDVPDQGSAGARHHRFIVVRTRDRSVTTAQALW
jgi:hypothetical protein